MSNGSGRLIAIGDVHGCAFALDALIEAIAPTSADRLVFLGDLIDNGRETKDVLNRILDLERRCEVILIQGNHEEMLYAAREAEQALRYWENCGGVATLNSYKFCGTLADIPAEHWALLDQCRPYYETDGHIFTHANYLHDAPMHQQPSYQLRWALFEPDKVQPHVSGKSLFVGHTEQSDGEILDLGFVTCLDAACWRYGWLTAIDVLNKKVWQASRWGLLREVGEETQRGRLAPLLKTGG
jgi:serine/threonine protein phosphatase 1